MHQRPRAFWAMLALFMLIIAPGCQSVARGQVRKEGIRDDATLVLDRHDRYLEGDGTIPIGDIDRGLEESRRARAQLVGDGLVKAKDLDGTLRPCLDRHDAYVEKDSKLARVEKRVFLRSTRLLRDTMAEAQGP